MGSLFGFTNPDIINRYQKEVKDEYYQVGYSVPWLQNMENFKETKEKFGEYPKVNKTVIPDEFKDFTINDVAAQFQPMARLNNSFYNGVTHSFTQPPLTERPSCFAHAARAPAPPCPIRVEGPDL